MRRRTYLGTLSVTVGALAGCTSADGDGASTPTDETTAETTETVANTDTTEDAMESDTTSDELDLREANVIVEHARMRKLRF
ncbi:hypothetical protein [Haloferax sp. DFSO60]|uniref:hypothetical protein n=1 Tax=Haloferax sp. DFSO60 TaxID=3388652 RepID=UPI00397BF1F9